MTLNVSILLGDSSSLAFNLSLSVSNRRHQSNSTRIDYSTQIAEMSACAFCWHRAWSIGSQHSEQFLIYRGEEYDTLSYREKRPIHQEIREYHKHDSTAVSRTNDMCSNSIEQLLDLPWSAKERWTSQPTATRLRDVPVRWTRLDALNR